MTGRRRRRKGRLPPLSGKRDHRSKSAWRSGQLYTAHDEPRSKDRWQERAAEEQQAAAIEHRLTGGQEEKLL